MAKEINYLLGYDNKYIIQNPDMFKFSLDSVLLPNFATLNLTYKKILDIGTGNAPIPLILSMKTNAKIEGVEIQKEVYDMAQESIKINKLENQIKIINGDINDLAKKMETDSYDLITCNPPYFKVNDNSIYNKNDYKTIARHEVKLNIEQVISISKKLLKNGGYLDVVNRPDRLVDILIIMRKNNIEPKRIQFVYPSKGKEANILLIEGRKNGQPGLKIMDPLYVYNNKKYTKEILEYIK